MPVATALATRLREAGTVRGLRIGIAMVLEPKTAQLALLLRDAGATVAVYAHPDEIDVEVAQVLRSRGIPVDGDPSPPVLRSALPRCRSCAAASTCCSTTART